MSSFLKIPKVQLSLVLLLIFFSDFIQIPNSNNLILLISSVGLCILFDLLFTYIRRGVFFIPFAAITTGVIITLTVNPNSNWLQLVSTTAFAMGAKNFIRISGKHIFNPAGFGLFAAGLIFSQSISWWAVSFQTVSFNFKNIILFLILLSPCFISAFRMRRFLSILSFLVFYNLLGLKFWSNIAIFDPTVIFFSTVMLPEPMTSPINYKRQLFYGLTVATLSFIFSFASLSAKLPDILIPALLMGNLIFFKFK